MDTILNSPDICVNLGSKKQECKKTKAAPLELNPRSQIKQNICNGKYYRAKLQYVKS